MLLLLLSNSVSLSPVDELGREKKRREEQLRASRQRDRSRVSLFLENEGTTRRKEKTKKRFATRERAEVALEGNRVGGKNRED